MTSVLNHFTGNMYTLSIFVSVFNLSKVMELILIDFCMGFSILHAKKAFPLSSLNILLRIVKVDFIIVPVYWSVETEGRGGKTEWGGGGNGDTDFHGWSGAPSETNRWAMPPFLRPEGRSP